MDPEKQEITNVEPQAIQLNIPADAPMMTRLAMMLEGGIEIDVEQMSKMQEMAERFEANEARKSFSADFTIAQSNISAVIKTKWNPQTKSNYADLGSVINMVKPVYTAQGFSVIFYEGETTVADNIRICADVLHRDGKGIAGKVNMIDIHAKATSVTYGQRYLMTMIWNIPTQDTDGNAPPAPALPPKVRPTSTTELEVIDAICEKLPPAGTGYVLNKGRIQAILMEKARDYLVFEKVDFCANQLMEKYADQLHEIDNSVPGEQPGEFETKDVTAG
jgi:hypothetical protein